MHIIDTDGVAALSIRHLGGALGVNGASLYYHYANKDAILDELVLHLLGDIRLEVEPIDDWKTHFLNHELAYRNAIAQHPNMAPIVLERRPRRFGVPVYEQGADVLLSLGIPPSEAWAILDHLEALALGSALLAMPGHGPDETFAATLDPGAKLALVLKARSELSDEQHFELAVRTFLDGVEHRWVQKCGGAGTTAVKRGGARRRRSAPAR